jgi:hypothetical protein
LAFRVWGAGERPEICSETFVSFFFLTRNPRPDTRNPVALYTLCADCRQLAENNGTQLVAAAKQYYIV